MSIRKKRLVTYMLHQDRLVVDGWRYLEPREIQMSYCTHARYFCNTCGEVWATEHVQFAEHYKVIHNPCAKCGNKNGQIGGSILTSELMGVRDVRWEGAPFDLLLYEFLNLMKQRKL